MSGAIIREGKHSFYRIEAEADYDGGFELRMITGNQPELLLKLHLSQDNHATYLDYNVSGLVSLSSCEEQSIDYLYGVVSGLDRLGDILPEYLLTPDGLRLDPDSVFIRRETGQIFFCYVPGQKEPFQQSLQTLMEYFMRVSAPTAEQDVLLLYGLYQKSREKTVTPGILAEYWRDSQKKSRKPEVAFPEVTDPEPLQSDSEIYAELGMETPKPEHKAILRLHRADENVPRRGIIERNNASEKGEKPRRSLLSDAFAKKKTVSDAPSKAGNRVAEFLKLHIPEFVIAAVVLVGAILILLT